MVELSYHKYESSVSIFRGVYLACLFYYEDRILTTDEDRYLPMLEVEDACQSLAEDFSWILKISCQWENLRQIQADIERVSNVSKYSLRRKFLNAAVQMQVKLASR